MQSMNALDLIFSAFLAVFILIGIFRGFFREVLGLVGIFGGIFLAILGFGALGKVLAAMAPGIPAFIWPIISFVIIFIAIYLSSRLLAGMLSKLSQSLHLGWLNRFLGGIVGGLKGAFILSLILLLIGFFPFRSKLENVQRQTMLYYPIQRFIPSLYNLGGSAINSPTNFEKKISDSLAKVQVNFSEEMMKYFIYGNTDSANN
jgi:membrane protein required for colicin V production